MDRPWSVDVARDIAQRAHANAFDKNGQPYFGHVRRVAQRAPRYAPAQLRSKAIEAGYLHDVLEDTPVNTADLSQAGCPDDVIHAVLLLTFNGREPYVSYIQRLRSNPIALAVKKADLDDNTDPARLAQLDEATRERLLQKYDKAKALLGHA